MSASIYDVVINGASYTGAAPADGFIDQTTSYAYMAQGSAAPSNLANAKAKMRANRRFVNIQNSMQFMCNAYSTTVTATGAGPNTAASSITIRFTFEHGVSSLSTADENNPGTFLTGAAAIKRCAARAMIRNDVRTMEYYDPTVYTGRLLDGGANPGSPRSAVINSETIGPLAANLAAAEATITVNLIS